EKDLETFITQELSRLLKHSMPLIRAEVILGEDGTEGQRHRFCNIRLITTGTGYIVAQHADTWENAVLAATEELHKKLKKDISNSLK
ncbi:MAG: HPF/RaiA family ribosome-associated protein, partial [Bacteroidetes bacterium]|nr:HPF/RaiA family ribosome-associated protein [Bacteroidota bacterium]